MSQGQGLPITYSGDELRKSILKNWLGIHFAREWEVKVVKILWKK